MLIVVGGTHAGSKLKSTEVSIFSHSLGHVWCAITFDCDYHLVRFPNPLAGSWGTWLLSPSSPLPQLIKGTELLWWREGLLEVRQLFRSKAWTCETFREFWRRTITYQVSGWAACAKVLLQRSNCGWSLWIWRSRESGNRLRLSGAGTPCKRNIAWFN